MVKKEGQYFDKYTNWEDFKNGMFDVSNIIDKHTKVIGAIDILTNPEKFSDILNKLVHDWPVSSKINLSNSQQNRRAWLGAAACSYEYKTPEYLTRIAWSLINKEHQDEANAVAESVILEYEKKMNHVQTLF